MFKTAIRICPSLKSLIDSNEKVEKVDNPPQIPTNTNFL